MHMRKINTAAPHAMTAMAQFGRGPSSVFDVDVSGSVVVGGTGVVGFGVGVVLGPTTADAHDRRYVLTK